MHVINVISSRKMKEIFKKVATHSTIVVLFILFFASQKVLAQDQEFGFMVGASNYHGDLAYNIVPGESHAAGGVHYRHNFNPHWSWRPSLMYGKVSGSDANFAEHKLRNLSFETDIWELSTIFEYNFLPFGSRTLSKNFTTYVMSGLSVYRFEPKANFNGNLVSLRNLRTEGQTAKEQYNLIQLAIPFGIGAKYNLSKNWVLGLEVGWRKLFTDYIDDVSTVYPDLQELRDNAGDLAADLSDRSWEVEGVGEPLSLPGDLRGDPELKDYFFFTTFNVSYRLTPISCWPQYRKAHLFR